MTKKTTSEIMRSIPSVKTTPELVLRRALRSTGLKFKYNTNKLPGKPDIVLPAKRLAVFIDGDYWHGNQWQNRGFSSLEQQFEAINDKDYWITKIKSNMNRDWNITSTLLDSGWRVLRIWESDIILETDKYVEIIQKHAGNGTANNYHSLPKRTFAEFFAGIGLMRMGLERNGWKLAFSNDIDPLKFKMYAGQFKDAQEHYLVKDIHKLRATDIPDVTLATASFPCTDLSLAGRRGGLEAKQSSAFWGFIRIIKELSERKPPLILLENVVGFISSKKGNDFARALRALNNLGYTVDAFIIDASNFVPQSRQRLFVVGILKENINSHPPFDEINETAQNDVFRPPILKRFIEENKDIAWELKNLPPPPKMNLQIADIVEKFPDNYRGWWSKERALYLLNQMSEKHHAKAMEMINTSKVSYGTVFRRVRNGKSMAELRTDGIAGCLRTPKGGSAKQILFVAGGGHYKVRLLTPREYARLMGVGDFNITVTDDQAYFGFGDAVCVPAINWISEYYLNVIVNDEIRGRLLG
jgi:DNA (cytosine-5)-methyltransferase 1